MNIPETLAACRAELARQKEMEKAATPGPWQLDDGVEPDIHTGEPIAAYPPRICAVGGSVLDGSGSQGGNADDSLTVLSRNLNPARLRVAEEMLTEVDRRWRFTTETDGLLIQAAVLLGVEVVK